jgi:hypothetical protein
VASVSCVTQPHDWQVVMHDRVVSFSSDASQIETGPSGGEDLDGVEISTSDKSRQTCSASID